VFPCVDNSACIVAGREKRSKKKKRGERRKEPPYRVDARDLKEIQGGEERKKRSGITDLPYLPLHKRKGIPRKEGKDPCPVYLFSPLKTGEYGP